MYKLDFLQTPRLDEKPDPDIKLLLSEALTRSLLLSSQSTLSLHTTACQQQEMAGPGQLQQTRPKLLITCLDL